MKKIGSIILFSSFFIFIAHCSFPETDRPPVDLNKPVENPALKDAIVNYKKQPNIENKAELEKCLNFANYLVPIITDEMKTKPTNKNGEVVVDKGSIIKFMVYKGAGRIDCLPVCTDWGEIGLFTKQKVNTLVMPSSQLWDFIMAGVKQEGYLGVVVNPGSDKLELSVKDVVGLEKLRRESTGK